jgi:hypothetical protein
MREWSELALSSTMLLLLSPGHTIMRGGHADPLELAKAEARNGTISTLIAPQSGKLRAVTNMHNSIVIRFS